LAYLEALVYLRAKLPFQEAKLQFVGGFLVGEHHCADHEEEDSEERGQGDHYAFVQSVRAAGGKTVFGAKV
jgi:hypothetical protein